MQESNHSQSGRLLIIDQRDGKKWDVSAAKEMMFTDGGLDVDIVTAIGISIGNIAYHMLQIVAEHDPDSHDVQKIAWHLRRLNALVVDPEPYNPEAEDPE